MRRRSEKKKLSCELLLSFQVGERWLFFFSCIIEIFTFRFLRFSVTGCSKDLISLCTAKSYGALKSEIGCWCFYVFMFYFHF